MVIRRGQIVQVVFLDHCEGGGVPLEFVVFGRLLSIDKTSLTVAGWTYANHKAKQDPTDPNIKCWTILRSTVKSLDRLCQKE